MAKAASGELPVSRKVKERAVTLMAKLAAESAAVSAAAALSTPPPLVPKEAVKRSSEQSAGER